MEIDFSKMTPEIYEEIQGLHKGLVKNGQNLALLRLDLLNIENCDNDFLSLEEIQHEIERLDKLIESNNEHLERISKFEL